MFTTQTLKIPDSNQPHQAFLHIVGKGAWGLEINDYFSMGREPSCTYSLSDISVSARHARIDRTDEGFVIKDLRSTNGTFVNGARIMEARLHEGDRIQIGETHLYFSFRRNSFDTGMLQKSQNEKWQATLEHIKNLAASDLPLLILGPSGSGKELIARNIHESSPRKYSKLISVNCSALNETLIESELFGHQKGSFTGATANRKGAFESARGGTLFLDEVGDLPLSLQPKLLRALENQEIRPVGSDECRKTDVRIVAATHHDLREMVLRGDFRLDLYYRLNVLQITAPSLRDRMEDFEDLVLFFSRQQQISISPAAIKKLKKYSWPGNIRELKNFIAKARTYYGNKLSCEQAQELLYAESPLVDVKEGSNASSDCSVVRQPGLGSSSFMKELEIELIRKRLEANGGNQRKTAMELGIPKSTLHDRIRTHKIKV